MSSDALERLAADLHAVYQIEANRQGDVRYHDEYGSLPENIKEYDRALARWILIRDARLEAAARLAGRLEQAERMFEQLGPANELAAAERDRLRREVEKG